MRVHVYNPSYIGWRGSLPKAGSGKIMRLPYEKITKSIKRAGNTVQVVEHLLSKYKDLSSIPSSTKKEEKQIMHPKCR
jgi:hypothetical protein